MTCYHRLPRSLTFRLFYIDPRQLNFLLLFANLAIPYHPNQKLRFFFPPFLLLQLPPPLLLLLFFFSFPFRSFGTGSPGKKKRGIGNRHPCCLCGIITRLLSLYHCRGYNSFFWNRDQCTHTYPTLLYLCVCVCIYPSSFFFFLFLCRLRCVCMCVFISGTFQLDGLSFPHNNRSRLTDEEEEEGISLFLLLILSLFSIQYTE